MYSFPSTSVIRMPRAVLNDSGSRPTTCYPGHRHPAEQVVGRPVRGQRSGMVGTVALALPIQQPASVPVSMIMAVP